MNTTTYALTRRQFISSAAAAGAVVLARPALGWRLTDTKLRVLSIGVVGTIGEADRHNLELPAAAAPRHHKLVTQTGAQRIEHPPRRAAVDILRSGGLGKVVEVHIAFGGSALAGGGYFADGKLGEPCEPPKGVNYDLW